MESSKRLQTTLQHFTQTMNRIQAKTSSDSMTSQVALERSNLVDARTTEPYENLPKCRWMQLWTREDPIVSDVFWTTDSGYEQSLTWKQISGMLLSIYPDSDKIQEPSLVFQLNELQNRRCTDFFVTCRGCKIIHRCRKGNKMEKVADDAWNSFCTQINSCYADEDKTPLAFGQDNSRTYAIKNVRIRPGTCTFSVEIFDIKEQTYHIFEFDFELPMLAKI